MKRHNRIGTASVTSEEYEKFIGTIDDHVGSVFFKVRYDYCRFFEGDGSCVILLCHLLNFIRYRLHVDPEQRQELKRNGLFFECPSKGIQKELGMAKDRCLRCLRSLEKAKILSMKHGWGKMTMIRIHDEKLREIEAADRGIRDTTTPHEKEGNPPSGRREILLPDGGKSSVPSIEEEKEQKEEELRPASRERLSPPKSPEKNGHANGNGESSAHTNGHANGKERKGKDGFSALNGNGHSPKKKKGGVIPAHRMEQAKRFHRYIDKRDKSFTKVNIPMWANVFGQIEEKFLGDIARVDALLDAFEQFGHLESFPQFCNPSTLLKQTKWVEDAAKRLSGSNSEDVKKRFRDMKLGYRWATPESPEFVTYCHDQNELTPEEQGKDFFNVR